MGGGPTAIDRPGVATVTDRLWHGSFGNKSASRVVSVGGEGPSRTALAPAHARAYHQIAAQPRILTDPLVARLLGVTADELARLDRPDRPRRLFFAARARFAED